MGPLKKSFLVALVIVVVAILGLFFFLKFEGEVPTVSLTPEPAFIGREATFTLACEDRRSGLKEIRIELIQKTQAILLFHETYASGTRRVEKPVQLSPLSLGLHDGEAKLRAAIRDHSWRPGGNKKVLEFPVTIDTRSPAIRVLSRLHYVNQGGAGLVVYQASEELARSGVKVGDLWFPGYQLTQGGFVCFFAVPFDVTTPPTITLVSEDLAGNRTHSRFYLRIKRKKFRNDTVRVTEDLLEKVIPYFTDKDSSLQGDLCDAFLRVNRDIRKASGQKIRDICQQTTPRPLWSGHFLRMERAKRMAGFAEHRTYMYKGKEIDRQYHLGIDLASVAMSPVKAANRGKVVFAGELGIYGNTILLDHGCGLFSMYGHLSQIHVQTGKIVERGEPIGTTGATGLASGDHLHFSIIISGVFVNPSEWWDPHWIKDNVAIKLALLKSSER